jgi:hypothetical protein
MGKKVKEKFYVPSDVKPDTLGNNKIVLKKKKDE